jgi:hypothetical protein
LLWLDCFRDIEAVSVFDDGPARKRRFFKFVLDPTDQIQDQVIEDASDTPGTMFMVRLSGLRDNGYRAKFPGRKEYVYQHITSHFLPTFIGGRCPRVDVYCGDETRSYPDAIDAIVHRRDPEITLVTPEYGDLHLTLMECDKVASSDLKGTHFVHFIAHDRTVRSQSIDAKLGLKYFGAHQDRVFHAIIRGDYLDKSVNQERTSFMFEDAVLDRIINDVCWNNISTFLAEPLASLSIDQRKTIKEITESYPSVAFGSVDELQDKIPSGELSSDAIYGHLSRERFRRDERQGEKIRGVLNRLKEGGANINTFTSAIEDARRAIEDAEQKSLAEYVVRRKVILDFMEIKQRGAARVDRECRVKITRSRE